MDDDFNQEVHELKEYFTHRVSEKDRQTPQYVYHYTSYENLRKILKSESIRLYDLLDMKDPEEFRHPLLIIRESIEPYWDKLCIKTSSFFRRTRDLELGHQWHAAIACFCEAPESKYMWRKYADEGKGVAIKCDVPALRKNPRGHGLYPMIYDDVWFRKMLHDSLEYVVRRNWDRFNFAEGNALSYQHCEQLLDFLFRIKRECFRPECEWRMLKLADSQARQHRDERGRRYVTIALDKAYVSGVVLGPDSPESEVDIRSFLNDTIYAGAEVTRSAHIGRAFNAPSDLR